MANVQEVTDQNFKTEVLESKKPAIIDFWAEWCAPCRQIAPIISELASEYGDRVKIILAFKDGRVVQQIQGARPKADFKKMVDGLLSA